MIERYTRKEMAQLWTLENKFRVWLEVELAVCKAWNSLGELPDEELAVILEKADFDVDRILEIEEVTRHDVIAFLTAVEEKVGPASRFIHKGCTSSDIVDTANGVLLKRAGDMILAGFDRLLGVLETLVKTHSGRLCMGRTHGVHAEPTSFGLKMAGYFAEFTRHREWFAMAHKGASVGKISGAVGTYAMVDPRIEALTCEFLGLDVDPISTQIIQRDRHARYFTALAIAAGGIERLCVELRHLQRTEVLEAEEGFRKGQKGSSAMPHKKNPISAENLTGLSRLIRTNSLAAMENMALWHERDISHSSVERVIMPDSTCLMDYALHRLCGLLERLVIKPDYMDRNLNASYGLYFSQKVLTALLKTGLPRQKAYEMVQVVAMRSWEEKTSFPDLVRNDPNITAHLTADELDALFDNQAYLVHEDFIVNRVFDTYKSRD